MELDAIWCQAGWVHLDPADFATRVGDIVEREPRWVLDGNYVDEIAQGVWPSADAIVWLDLPRRVAVRRAVLRSARRALAREELWNGNRQGFDVLSPRSVARLWSRWPSYNDTIRLALRQVDRSDLEVVRLTSTEGVRTWVSGLPAFDPP